MNILGIIPARGGSKGIPRKNLQKINGKSLLQYAIEAGQDSHFINRLFVSTEDQEIKKESIRLNCDVLDRPDDLANDNTPTKDVILEILSVLGDSPNCIVLLQPTAPLRTATHIDEAIEIFMNHDCDSVVSVAEVPSHYHPDWQLIINDGKLLVSSKNENLSQMKYQRQELTKTYFRNGAVYISKADTIKKYKNLYGTRCIPYVMPIDASVNIDTPADLVLASNSSLGE